MISVSTWSHHRQCACWNTAWLLGNISQGSWGNPWRKEGRTQSGRISHTSFIWFVSNKSTALIHWPLQSQFSMAQLHCDAFPRVLIRDTLDKFLAGENVLSSIVVINHNSGRSSLTKRDRQLLFFFFILSSFLVIPETQLRHVVI